MFDKLMLLLVGLIPSKRRRTFLRNRFQTAKAVRESGGLIRVHPDDFSRVRLEIEGFRNRIAVGRLRPGKGILRIKTYGDDNVVVIGDGLRIGRSLDMVAGQEHPNFGPVCRCRFRVGQNCSFEGCMIQTYNSGASVVIGDDCMFASVVNLFHSDAHPVYSIKGGLPVNRVGEMSIGNHVWVGERATILKNSSVADDSIVGYAAVVSGKFSEPHCVLAGNPARVVKCDITWKEGDPAYTGNGVDI